VIIEQCLDQTVPAAATWDGEGRAARFRCGKVYRCRMSVYDLVKATVVCGGVAFLFNKFPILGQILMIAVCSVLWLSYLRKVVLNYRRKKLA
jgi:hypothetical protein